MKVAEVMNATVIACTPQDLLSRAAQIMWEADCGCVPVVDSERLVGIVTDRDLCMAGFTQGRSLAQIPVGAAMAKRLFTCRPSDSLTDVFELMGEQGLRRLPVVDGEGRLVGLFSLADAFQAANREKTKKRLELADRLFETLVRVTKPRTARPAPEAMTETVLEPAPKKAKSSKKKSAKARS
jgi:CBS domain-containing protein